MDKTKAVLAHFRKTDPVMFSIAKKSGVLEIKPRRPNYYFYALCREIIGQQLAGSAAKAIFSRFEKLFPDCKINPHYAAKLREEQIRNIGTSWAKARYIIDLGRKVSSGELNLKSMAKMENQQVIESLTQVKGIGPWTAEMFLMFTMGREDVFSHGDLGLRKAIIKNYSLKSPSKEKIGKISAKWSPYRTYACRTLWKSLEA